MASRARSHPAARALAAAAAIASAGLVAASTGEVSGLQKISSSEGGFDGDLDNTDFLGRSLLSPGDLDGDGVSDLLAGAIGDDANDIFDSERGVVWILFLNGDGTVKAHQRIGQGEGGFAGDLAIGDQFGTSLAWLGDLDGDGTSELAVGAYGADDGGTDRGALWILSLGKGAIVQSTSKISAVSGGFGGDLHDGDLFGGAVASVGDLDGNGVVDLAVSAPGDDGTAGPGGGSMEQGAVWILFMEADRSVAGVQRIAAGEGGFVETFATFDHFGWALAPLGDLGGDGRPELAVGGPLHSDGGQRRGAVWILSLDPDGTVAAQATISSTLGDFAGPLENEDDFGYAVAAPGDLDRDGIVDLVVGCFGDDDGGQNAGAVWVLLLRSDGSVRDEVKISEGHGGFTADLITFDHFGSALAGLGDLDGDELLDIAIGALGDDDGGPSRGAVWIALLDGRPTCLWDCGGSLPDQEIAVLDLLILLAQWGADGSCELDGDGVVAIGDLLALLGRWGPCPSRGP